MRLPASPERALRRSRRRPRLVLAMPLAFAVGMAALPEAAPAAPAASQEYDLKAVFLFNFAQFAEWPAEAFDEPEEPFVIGVLGDDPFGKTLDDVVAGETIRQRPLVVRRYRTVGEIGTCHILFISPSEADRQDAILASLGRRSILTVGETKDFAVRSGIIGFELMQRRLRLRINLAASKRAGVKISSKLLRQAVVVRPAEARR